MFSRLAWNLACFFVEKNIIKSEEKEIYAYGYEIIISETINWIITIIIAIFTKKIIETAVYMLAFMRLRGALGGFHAKSHMGCIVISALVYVLCLYIINKTPINIYWILIVGGLLLHMGLVIKIAPVAHPNKPFINEREYLKFKKKSYKLSFIYCGICIMLFLSTLYILKIYSYCILLGMLSASISMLIEYIRQRHNKIRERRCKK